MDQDCCVSRWQFQWCKVCSIGTKVKLVSSLTYVTYIDLVSDYLLLYTCHISPCWWFVQQSYICFIATIMHRSYKTGSRKLWLTFWCFTDPTLIRIKLHWLCTRQSVKQHPKNATQLWIALDCAWIELPI